MVTSPASVTKSGRECDPDLGTLISKPTKISRRIILAIILSAITITSAITATEGTINYYNFYPAVQQLQLNITTFQSVNVNSNQNAPVLELQQITLTVKNPTDYKGLALTHVGATLYIISLTSNQTSPQGILPYAPGSGPLSPGNTITIAYPNFNATSDASIFAAKGYTMRFAFDVQIVLASFLDRIGSITISYLCNSPGGPVNCVEVSVDLSGAPGGVTGSGGGG